MCDILSVVNASGFLMDNKCAMGCRAAAFREMDFLIVGDLGIQFIRCSEPGIVFGTKDPVEKIV